MKTGKFPQDALKTGLVRQVEAVAQPVLMEGLVKTRNASVVLDMQGNTARNLCVRRNVKMEEDVSDQTDVPVCMVIQADTVRLTTEQDPVTGRLKMTSVLGHYRELFAPSSYAVLPLERHGGIHVNAALQS